MVWSYLFSWEFWRNICVLFMGCCVLAPLLYWGVKLLIGIVSICGESSSSSKDDHEAGCAGCLFLILVYGLVYWIGSAVLDSIREAGYFKLKTDRLVESGREIGNVGIFAKEAPLLYEYNSSLERFIAAEKAYLTVLEREGAQITTSYGKAPLKKQMEQVKKDIRKLEEKQQSIAELANRLYFARYLQNLGVNIDDSSLKGEMKQTQTETERVVSESEKKINARKN